MPLTLLVDEDTQAKRLVMMLRDSGHDVRTVADAARCGQSDPVVFALACAENRTLLTRNAADFLALHLLALTENQPHPGVLAVYQDSNPAKNMSYVDIVRAIGNIDSTQTPLANAFLNLNAYRW